MAGEETGKLSKAGFNEFVRKKTKDLQEPEELPRRGIRRGNEWTAR